MLATGPPAAPDTLRTSSTDMQTEQQLALVLYYGEWYCSGQ